MEQPACPCCQSERELEIGRQLSFVRLTGPGSSCGTGTELLFEWGSERACLKLFCLDCTYLTSQVSCTFAFPVWLD